LLGCPLGGGGVGDVVDDAPPLVRKDHEEERHLEHDSGHGEEVHREECLEVLSRNVRHICAGGVLRRLRYLDTVACAIWMPSFWSSP
jgi:hypothetical protein